MIVVRRAQMSDAECLFEWRNDEGTRAASISVDELHWSEHVDWLTRVIADPHRFLYIVELDRPETDPRIAVCRFDLGVDDAAAEVSINLSPAIRGRGLARDCLAAAIAQFRADVPRDLPLTATIRPTNTASVRTFEGLGFQRTGESDGFDRFRLPF